MDDYQALLDQSMEELRLKTELHDGSWGLAEASWSVDQDLGTIEFENSNGMSASCPVQIVGTFNSEDGTWLWGWDHPSVEPALRAHAQRVHDFGAEHGLSDLTTRKLVVTEDEAWEFAALACHLSDAQGAFRGVSGETYVFMTFGEVQLSRHAEDT